MSDTFNEIKNKANLVRQIDLVSVLKLIEAVQDKSDKHKWHTSQGVISVSGTKFINWNKGIGGGGAIDLAIHLNNFDFKTAVFWLARTFLSGDMHRPCDSKLIKESEDRCIPRFITPKSTFQSPPKDDTRLPQVVNYLLNTRSIPLPLIKSLIHSGKLYADIKGNAVFLLLGKEKKVVGAELRGTTRIRWRGMAPGSRKDLGYFCVENPSAKNMVLCESAIDAISFFALCPTFLAVSTAGANPNPLWLASFIDNGYEIYCGFDSDETGDRLAQKMIALYPTVKRLRPSKHDWNDVLIDKSRS
ncbi:MAG: DUF3991 and TOPRIM domain-containing protein [Thermodesulfobacteriota bacterium]